MKYKYHLIAALIIPLVLPSTSFAAWVCYDTRSTYKDVNGMEHASYGGCFISRTPCGRQGANHFGHYPNARETYRALKRCQRGTPRFID